MRDEVPLTGGDTLVVRPIRPEDGPALLAMHARLSTDTIYRRYFGARPHLSPADVTRFTVLSEAWRFALVATRGTDLVAVARYEGAPGAAAAEIAIVVDDALQHHGVGRAMLERLADVARERGLTSLVADVLPGNAPMLGLLRGLGLPMRQVREPDSVTATLDLGVLDPEDVRVARARSHIAAVTS
jgi:GNAT superfamily N-acetyltransferase